MKDNVVRDIGFKNLKNSKKSNIVLGIAITLVAAFLTTIMAVTYSMNIAFKEDMARSGFGAYNASIFSKGSEEINNLKNHALVDKVGESLHSTEMITYKEGKIYTSYEDEIAIELKRINIAEGQTPKEKDEIVIDREFSDKNKLGIGDKFTTNEGVIFKITGISEDNIKDSGDSYTGYVSKERVLENKPFIINGKDYTQSLYITVKSKFNIENKLNKIAEDLGYETKYIIDDNITGNFIINEFMLGVNGDVLISFIVLTLLIVATAFFIIYNLVSINFVERVKNYGLLVTIGMNRKQLKGIMWWEIFILSIISIPFGILLGMGIGKVAIPMIPIELYVPLEVTYKLWFIPVVVLITLATVFISIIGPVRRSTKISPVDATRFTGDTNVTRMKVRETKNVFNDLARGNIWRNKRATLTIVISLTLSSILFLVASTLLKSMSLDNYIKTSFVAEDIKVSIKNEFDYFINGGISKEYIKEIENNESVKAVYGNKKIVSSVENKTYDMYSLNVKDIENLKKYFIEGSLNKEDYIGKNKVIIPAWRDINEVKYKVGDKVSINVNGVEEEFEVGAIVSNFDIMSEVRSQDNILLYEDNKFFEGSDYLVAHIETQKGKASDVKKEIMKSSRVNENMDLLTFDEVDSEQSMALKQINFGGYLIVGIIGLIGILNYTITIVTNVLSRRKEFGLIRALGVKEKELRRMVMMEGMYLSAIIGGVGIACGNILGYVLYTAFKKEATYAIYSFPWIQNIILILVLIVIPLMMYRAAIKSIIKVPVVEQIKYSE